VDWGEAGVRRAEVGIQFVFAEAILAEQIHIGRHADRKAGDQLPLEAAMAAAEDVEAGAVGAQRAAEAADAETTAQRDLPVLGDRDVIHQVDHVGGDLVATAGGEHTGAIELGIMLRE
jgi:hypothetical protein